MVVLFVIAVTLTTAGYSQSALKSVNAADLMHISQQSEAEVTMVNIWATQCQPCVEEFPDLMRVYREYKDSGFEPILVSADFRKQEPGVKDFLTAQGLDFPSYIKTGDDMEFINTLQPDWSGAIPATFVFDKNGVKRDLWVGKVSYDKFKLSVEETLNNNNEDK